MTLMLCLETIIMLRKELAVVDGLVIVNILLPVE